MVMRLIAERAKHRQKRGTQRMCPEIAVIGQLDGDLPTHVGPQSTTRNDSLSTKAGVCPEHHGVWLSQKQ